MLIASRSAEKLTRAAEQLQQTIGKTVEWQAADVRKAGMLSLMKTLAAELAGQHIRINSVWLTSLWTNRADAMAAGRRLRHHYCRVHP